MQREAGCSNKTNTTRLCGVKEEYNRYRIMKQSRAREVSTVSTTVPVVLEELILVGWRGQRASSEGALSDFKEIVRPRGI